MTFKNVFQIKSNFINFFIKILDTLKHNIVNILMEIRQIASQDNIINDYFEQKYYLRYNLLMKIHQITDQNNDVKQKPPLTNNL